MQNGRGARGLDFIAARFGGPCPVVGQRARARNHSSVPEGRGRQNPVLNKRLVSCVCFNPFCIDLMCTPSTLSFLGFSQISSAPQAKFTHRVRTFRSRRPRLRASTSVPRIIVSNSGQKNGSQMSNDLSPQSESLVAFAQFCQIIQTGRQAGPKLAFLFHIMFLHWRDTFDHRFELKTQLQQPCPDTCSPPLVQIRTQMTGRFQMRTTTVCTPVLGAGSSQEQRQENQGVACKAVEKLRVLLILTYSEFSRELRVANVSGNSLALWARSTARLGVFPWASNKTLQPNNIRQGFVTDTIFPGHLALTFETSQPA